MGVIARMSLLKGDPISLLPGLAPEIVPVDPCTRHARSALVKLKCVRYEKGVDEDQRDLMKVALATASKRVVLNGQPLAAPMVIVTVFAPSRRKINPQMCLCCL